MMWCIKMNEPLDERLDELENYYDSYRQRLENARKEMDCISGHCSGCCYLINHVCELAESLI